MKTIITIGAALVTATLAASAFAQSNKSPSIMKRDVVPMRNFVLLGCEVNGSPSEFPDDLFFTNTTGKTLAAGTKVHWQTKGPVYKNTWTLASALQPGAGVRASNILPNGIEAGKRCSATVTF